MGLSEARLGEDGEIKWLPACVRQLTSQEIRQMGVAFEILLPSSNFLEGLVHSPRWNHH
jgi:hypothetical protein